MWLCINLKSNCSNACLVILREELVPGITCIDGTVALAVSANGFPVALALGIGIPEGVDFIVVASLGIFLGGVPVKDALELGFYIISCWLLAHGGDISTQMEIGNEIIQNLSKSDFRDPNSLYNMLLLLTILCYLLTIHSSPLRGRRISKPASLARTAQRRKRAQITFLGECSLSNQLKS